MKSNSDKAIGEKWSTVWAGVLAMLYGAVVFTVLFTSTGKKAYEKATPLHEASEEVQK